MLRGEKRERVKRLLALSRIRLAVRHDSSPILELQDLTFLFQFTKITQTRYTTFFFFFSIISTLLLAALHGVLLYDNTAAVNILSPLVHSKVIPAHIAFIEKSTLRLCDGIPERANTTCNVFNITPNAVQDGIPQSVRQGLDGAHCRMRCNDSNSVPRRILYLGM